MSPVDFETEEEAKAEEVFESEEAVSEIEEKAKEDFGFLGSSDADLGDFLKSLGIDLPEEEGGEQ